MNCGMLSTTARTTTGTTALTGLGFTPKIFLPFGALRTSTGVGPTSGFCELFWGRQASYTASAKHAASTWAPDNVTPSDGFGSFTVNHSIEILDTNATPTVAGQAHVTSWDADGLTLDWTQAASSAWLVNGLAIGGTDITNVAFDVILVNTSAGVQTFSGYGFQPDFILTWRAGNFWTIGMASSSAAANQACLFGVNVNGENPSSTARTFSAGNVHGGYRTTGAAHPFTISQDMLCTLNSFTADGFTINKSDPPANTRSVSIMLLKGGSHKVGVATARATTGTDTVTTGIDTKGLYLVSDCEGAGSASPDGQLAIGMTDGSSSASALFAAQDNQAPTVVEQYAGTDVLGCGIDYSGPTVTTKATSASLDNGSFTLDWTTVSGNQEQYIYWAMGGAQHGNAPQVIRYNRTPRVG